MISLKEFSELAHSGLESLQPASDDRGMLSTRRWKGRMLGTHTPTWDPLLELAPDHIDDFMWMFEVALEAGPHLHA